jgi:hypothetical protein
MARIAWNLTDVVDGFLKDHRLLICDRVEVVLTPKRAPNCNASAERFVISIKSECL